MEAGIIIAAIVGAITGVTSIGTLTGWILEKFDKSLEKIRKEISTANQSLKAEIKADIQILSNKYYSRLDEQISNNRQALALLKEEFKSETILNKTIQKSIFQKIEQLEKELEKI
ncbi:hypothetical protein [Geminocystis sp. NIES-3709]|uniref:hypothetical protein n=1 Tax=Geminocystis sp. NIES-3709 TaxID=1617448 RepID=UPI0005FC7A8C|nr:hypothetical protein [Geminocystis sp. NIES-3709]BAQ65541.1 hypothetical protein GM3709_2306 [Geminocystis sp. NIES-3709]